MPSFADVYNNAPAPSVHSTRYPLKSTHPTSTSHIPPDAKPLDTRRMSSSKAGMGRTRGTERSSKPEEAPQGPEFAERTRNLNADETPSTTSPGPSDGSTSPTSGRKSAVLGAFDKRRTSSGSPRLSDENVTEVAAEEQKVEGERRGSISNFFKKVF